MRHNITHRALLASKGVNRIRARTSGLRNGFSSRCCKTVQLRFINTPRSEQIRHLPHNSHSDKCNVPKRLRRTFSIPSHCFFFNCYLTSICVFKSKLRLHCRRCGTDFALHVLPCRMAKKIRHWFLSMWVGKKTKQNKHKSTWLSCAHAVLVFPQLGG